MNINWIQKLKIAFASLALLGLTACGGAGGGGGSGGGGSTLVGQAGIQVTSAYNVNVRVPSAQEAANIQVNSDSTLTVSANSSYQIDQIIVINNKAYKITSLTSSAGKTVLQTTSPTFDEIFSDFVLKGSVALPSNAGTQAGLRLNSVTDRFKKYQDPTQLFKFNTCASASTSSLIDTSGKTYVGLKATFDKCVITNYLTLDGSMGITGTIDFDIDTRSGKTNITPNIRFDPSIFIGLMKAKEGSFIAPIYSFMIPIPTTFGLLEITVPIDIILSGKIRVADGIGIDGKIISTLALKKNSSSENFSFIPTVDASDIKVTMPHGQVTAEIGAQIRFGVGIAALTVNLVHYDPRIGLLAEGKAQVAVKIADGTITCGGLTLKAVGGADVILAQNLSVEKSFQLISIESDPFWEAPFVCGQIPVLTPSISNIDPLFATLNIPTTFTVTGTDLPLTTEFKMQDANCQAPVNPTTNGFTVSCTPTLVGSKGITISDSPAGNVIDGARTVNVSAATVITTGTLNDTGITANQCYQAGSDVLVSCSSAGAIALNNAQDGMTGRDVTVNNNADGKGGFSFSAVAGGCVQDNVTGLMWEVKTTDGGLRDWSKTYTHYDSTLTAQNWNGTTYSVPTQAEIDAPTNSIGFVKAVNAQGLCGFNDWRLPTADELQSIVDYGVAFPGPAIDTAWFPNTQATAFWSASSYVGVAHIAWVVHFGSGGLDPYNLRVSSYYVRLVRGCGFLCSQNIP